MSGTNRNATADAAPLSALSDEALIDRVASADQAAISELYDRYQAVMYGLATRITRDAALAEDVVQEAFVGIWRNAAVYSGGRASVRTWVLSITHHRAIDAVRRRRPTTNLPDADQPQTQSLVVPDVWPEVARHLDADAIRAAMAGLPDLQREAIEMAYFGGLTQHEIAAQTDAPLGTVKSRVRLGLLQLRRLMEAQGSIEPTTDTRELVRPAEGDR